MYAIVDIAGQQFKVEKDKKLYVHRLDGKEGSSVEFDQVLLIDNDKDVTVGTPVISGAMVTGKILGHVKGDKVIVFKKKRRKGYQKRNGHRQYMTSIVIEDIIEKGAKPKAAEKKVSPKAKKEEPVKEAAKTAPAAETKESTKAPASKAKSSETKTSAKKPAASTKEKPATGKSGAGKSASDKSTTAKKPATKKPATKKSTAGTSKTSTAKKAAAKKTAEKKDGNKEK